MFNLVDDIQGVFVSLDCLGVEDSSTLDMLAPLFFKNYKFIFGRQALRCCAGSLQLQHPGDSSICSVQASHFVAFSRCGVWILGHLCFSGFGHVGSVLAPRLWGADSIVVAQGFSCSQACGIFLDEGLNPCLLY